LSSKVEEVARAIAGTAWETLSDRMREQCRYQARQAIKAMHGPTEAMVSSALHDHATNAPYETPFGPDGSFARQFNTMISAALSEGEG